MKNLLLFIFLIPTLVFCQKTEELANIKIARDQWGVPHIYAPTDREVAYGLAWVQCEDDFNTLQEQMMAVRGKYGEYKGVEGIVLDFGIKFMGLREVVEAKYETDLSEEFRQILEYYVEGINNYATLHPEEVLMKKLFPLKGQDIIIGYLLGLVEMSGGRRDLMKILNGEAAEEVAPKGSNAIAVSSKKTTDGKTYLAINSHQPLEGWYSWYEAHLMSDEGLNILGGTFPGGVSIFHGVNEHLGWAHTVNHNDLSDVFELEINPKKKKQYRFDGKWLDLKKRKYKSKLKLAFLKIPISKKIYESKYGPTFKTKKGTFSWRAVAALDIRSAEQWFRMNKATNFEEFKSLLEWLGVCTNNVVYADKENNIYYVSLGKQPVRNPKFDWSKTLPGNTSETLWSDYHPFDRLPQVLNPESGYVFNTNNTPFSSSAKADNPVETELNKTMGFQATNVENNRSNRFMELIGEYDKLSYDDFKKIKYDEQYPSKLTQPNMTNLELLLSLNERKYPEIATAIQTLNRWNRSTDEENLQATLAILTIDYLVKSLVEAKRFKLGSQITEKDCAQAIQKAQSEMMEKYGTLEIELGKIQRHIRGEVSLPLGGGPDILRAMYSQRTDDNKLKGFAGESYIEMVKFSKDGVEIETVNAYGSSAKPYSPHYTDQMEMFVGKQLKTMSLDKEKAFEEAVKIYSPMKVVN
jgi:acyl-homoserine-lactone acylase